jgi:hypothetical protein
MNDRSRNGQTNRVLREVARGTTNRHLSSQTAPSVCDRTTRSTLMCRAFRGNVQMAVNAH